MGYPVDEGWGILMGFDEGFASPLDYLSLQFRDKEELNPSHRLTPTIGVGMKRIAFIPFLSFSIFGFANAKE